MCLSRARALNISRTSLSSYSANIRNWWYPAAPLSSGLSPSSRKMCSTSFASNISAARSFHSSRLSWARSLQARPQERMRSVDVKPAISGRALKYFRNRANPVSIWIVCFPSRLLSSDSLVGFFFFLPLLARGRSFAVDSHPSVFGVAPGLSFWGMAPSSDTGLEVKQFVEEASSFASFSVTVGLLFPEVSSLGEAASFAAFRFVLERFFRGIFSLSDFVGASAFLWCDASASWAVGSPLELCFAGASSLSAVRLTSELLLGKESALFAHTSVALALEPWFTDSLQEPSAKEEVTFSKCGTATSIFTLSPAPATPGALPRLSFETASTTSVVGSVLEPWSRVSPRELFAVEATTSSKCGTATAIFTPGSAPWGAALALSFEVTSPTSEIRMGLTPRFGGVREGFVGEAAASSKCGRATLICKGGTAPASWGVVSSVE
eukprot:RCo019197